MDDWHMDAWQMNDECCMDEKHGCKKIMSKSQFLMKHG
jgi:hypothetical protein